MNFARDPADPLSAESRRCLTLVAPGRLHLGFLDPSGTLGRRFGSLGLVISGFHTQIELSAAPADANEDTVIPLGANTAAEHERTIACLQRLKARTDRHAPLELRLIRTLPPHAGFGSGTQLALAIGRAFSHWHGLDLSTHTIASLLGRGQRSGVGIAGFDRGGLLLDGGPNGDGSPPPLLMRTPLPNAWRVIVALDPRQRGLSGDAERHAIGSLLPLPRASAADICHQVLMRIMPGAASADFAPFAAGVSHIQDVLGAHFAVAQVDKAYASPAVGRLMRWIANQAAAVSGAAVGQSSWGPTGFAILPSQAQAESLVASASEAGIVDAALQLHIVSPRNHGATIVDTQNPTAGDQRSHHEL